MKRSGIVLTGLSFLLLPVTSVSQENKTVTVNGYLTTMQSAIFDSLPGPFVNENLLHNRLNFTGYFSNNLTLAVEIRNRFFTGDRVRMGNYFSGMIGEDQGMADMSWNVLEEQSFLLNTTIDRLWLDLRFKELQITLGRQRINWGQTFVWNPNDIFNTYSFFDFDYVERPGSDAVRLQYFPSSASAAEMAVKLNRDGRITAAGLYRFNRWGYDIQLLAGVADGSDLVAGAGWSGQIGSLAFRGEVSWFSPYRNSQQKKNTLLITTGLDKVFKDNSLAQVQFMYCNKPLEFDDFTTLYFNNLSTKDIAYSRITAFGQFSKAITPLLNLSLSAMWFPDLDGFFAGPSLEYSLAENLGFSFFWQHFKVVISDLGTNLNLAFLRIKYNF